MDKIYSRKRLKLPRIKGFKYEEKYLKNKKKNIILITIVIAIMSAILIIKQLNPIFDSLCIEKAKGLATEKINKKSNSIFKNISYEELVNIVTDEKRRYYYAKG